MADLNRVRAALVEIDTAVHNLWDLGKNMVVGWTANAQGLQIALAPCIQVFARALSQPDLLRAARYMDGRSFRRICKVLQARVLRLPLPGGMRGNALTRNDIDAIDSVIRRYSIVRTEHRAMVLFENVDFARATAVQQMAQFVSLEHSLAEAAEQMERAGLPVELARSTAGDGALYVWNRDAGLGADLRTYAAMILALLGNAAAQRTEAPNSGIVPRLRTVFAIGSHHSYHQVEANRPRMSEYATGQVSIALARLAASALPGQILLASFDRPVGDTAETLDSILFVARAEKMLAGLNGCRIGEQPVESIRSIVTSGEIGTGSGILKYTVEDKHRYRHDAFNLRVRATHAGQPLELGLRAQELSGFPAASSIYELPLRSSGVPRTSAVSA